jgi:GTP-binding protein YchF
VGKSTLFNALTKSYAADAANFPFCTIDPNVGVVDVNDTRLQTLATISQTQKIVPATIKFVDIAGLVKGASQGEGMGNAFLSHIREVDAIVQVLRHFKDAEINHVEGEVDPIRDEDIITTELILSDLEQIDKKLPHLQRKAKSGDKETLEEMNILERAKALLEERKLIYDLHDDLTKDEKKYLKTYNFLTNKPFVYAMNVGESELSQAKAIQEDFAAKLGKPTAVVCARLESEMIEMDDEEREMLLEEHGDVPTLDDLIALAFREVGLMYYFTTGVKETRAWTVCQGSTAPQAAAAIHKDFERGFIKAEVVSYDDLVVTGGWSQAKDAGKLKLQGKDYVVQDGDVIVFKFAT